VNTEDATWEGNPIDTSVQEWEQCLKKNEKAAVARLFEINDGNIIFAVPPDKSTGSQTSVKYKNPVSAGFFVFSGDRGV